MHGEGCVYGEVCVCGEGCGLPVVIKTKGHQRGKQILQD